jgi:hypothetical protein
MQTRSSKSPPASEERLPTRPRAFWDPDDEFLLLETILTKKRELGVSMSNGTFPERVFGEAAIVLNEKRTNLRSKGSEKTANSCNTKFKKVCIPFVRVLPVS